MELVASHGGMPYIAFKSNSTGGEGGTLAKMFHLYCLNREEYMDHYHKRSNIEADVQHGQGEVRGPPAQQDRHRDGQ